MPTGYSLLQLALGRAQGALNRIQEIIWHSRTDLTVEATHPQSELITLKKAKTLPLQHTAPRHHWGRLFDQRWCKIHLPSAPLVNSWLFWVDQGEATLYVNDRPHFGFNVAHRHCLLPPMTKQVWVQSACIQSAVWHPNATGLKEGGSLFEGAYLMKRNDLAWRAYHDLKCLLDLADDIRHREKPEKIRPIEGAGLQHSLDRHSPEYRKILKGMEQAVDAFDTIGLTAMIDLLAEVYASLRLDKTFASTIMTGHAHVDLVWLWPERMGELKAVNTFATADYLLEQYPEFRFAYSQPTSYAAVEQREPELYQAVKTRIQNGQWQATGAMEVESDTLIACGEALARSFTIGQDSFIRICGNPSQLTWLPDVFGYSACLPQIMEQCGVKYFFTTKMTWNAINRFPYSSFIWRGPDGAEVIAHVTQDSGYNALLSIGEIKSPMLANMQAELHDEYLLPVGYGDGGGGPTDEMLERARRLGGLPSMPDIHWDHPEAFFERLASAPQLPIHEGECYLEYHRGVYTTHAIVKAAFRQLEQALQVSEAVSASSGVTWDREHTWKRLIFAQFHDFIPGSSVWDVYMEGVPELTQLAARELTLVQETLESQGEPCLFNPHALPFDFWHTHPDGQIELLRFPPLGGFSIREAERVPLDEPVVCKGLNVCNGITSFTVNQQGWIEMIEWSGEKVPIESPLGQLCIYSDRAANFDAWDIDAHVIEMGTVCQSSPTIEVIQKDTHKCAIQVSRPIGQSSQAKVTFSLQQNCPVIDIQVELDWQEHEHLLKLHLPTNYSGREARFGAPFGSVLRPQKQTSMLARAMWEVPFSRHLAVFDEGERKGLFLITKDKYGVSVRNGNIGLSLVRSPRVTGFDTWHPPAWPAHLSQYKDMTQYSDLGSHKIELAIGPYCLDSPRERQPAALAETRFTPPLQYTGKSFQSPILSLIQGETLIPSWVKQSSDGSIILRLHEVGGQRGQAQLNLLPGYHASQTNLQENTCTALPQNRYIDFKPYQLISIMISPSSQ